VIDSFDKIDAGSRYKLEQTLNKFLNKFSVPLLREGNEMRDEEGKRHEQGEVKVNKVSSGGRRGEEGHKGASRDAMTESVTTTKLISSRA